jgi:hypothetical protein
MDDGQSELGNESAAEIVERTVRESMEQFIDGAADPILEAAGIEDDPTIQLIRRARWKLLKAYLDTGKWLEGIVIFSPTYRLRRSFAKLRYGIGFPWESVANIVGAVMLFSVAGVHPARALEVAEWRAASASVRATVTVAGGESPAPIAPTPRATDPNSVEAITSPPSVHARQPAPAQVSIEIKRDERRIQIERKVSVWVGDKEVHLIDFSTWLYCDSSTKKTICDAYEQVPSGPNTEGLG